MVMLNALGLLFWRGWRSLTTRQSAYRVSVIHWSCTDKGYLAAIRRELTCACGEIRERHRYTQRAVAVQAMIAIIQRAEELEKQTPG